MKLLLDENIPVKLKGFFSKKHQVQTVKDQGWAGKKNGELLGLMVLDGFEGLVTVDKSLANQQNIKRFDLAVFILNAANNKLQILKPFVKKLEMLIADSKEVGIIQINTN